METNRCTHCEHDNRVTNKYCSECGYELPKIEAPKVIEAEKPNKKTNWPRVVAVGVGVGVMMLTANFGPKMLFNTMTTDMKLMQVASEANKMCPFYVDAGTRLDNSVALPNSIFQYNFTLVDRVASDIDTTVMKAMMEVSILNTIQTSPELKFMRDEKVTLSYYYKDMNGKYICRMLFPYEKYKENN